MKEEIVRIARELHRDKLSPEQIADHIGDMFGYSQIIGEILNELAQEQAQNIKPSWTQVLGLPTFDYIQPGIHCVNITLLGTSYMPGYIQVKTVEDGENNVTEIIGVGIQPHMINEI